MDGPRTKVELFAAIRRDARMEKLSIRELSRRYGVHRAWHETGGTLTMPVLAVGGEHSSCARLANSLDKAAPLLTGEVIAGSGHFVPEERPDAFARELLPFLAASPRTAGRI
jgi:pimeloyl-ACP methyl ester carboxylesterase